MIAGRHYLPLHIRLKESRTSGGLDWEDIHALGTLPDVISNLKVRLERLCPVVNKRTELYLTQMEMMGLVETGAVECS